MPCRRAHLAQGLSDRPPATQRTQTLQHSCKAARRGRTPPYSIPSFFFSFASQVSYSSTSFGSAGRG